MKKVFIWLIIISMVAVFSLAGCKPKEETEELEAKIAELEEELEAVKEEAAEEPAVEEVTGEPEEEALDESEVGEKEKSTEEIKEETRDIFKEYIEEGLGGQLTKFVLDDSDENPENWVAYISYNSKWASEDTIKREMYEIVDFYAQSLFGIFYELDLTAASGHSGDNYNCFNPRELLGKICNYEIDYAEWLNEVFK
jgi:hypothetical protein